MFTMNYPGAQIGRAPKLYVQVNGFKEKEKTEQLDIGGWGDANA